MIPTPDEVLLDAQYDCPEVDKCIEENLLGNMKSWAGKDVYLEWAPDRYSGIDYTSYNRIRTRLQELGWELSIDRYELKYTKRHPVYRLGKYYPPTRLATKISMIWKILTNRF